MQYVYIYICIVHIERKTFIYLFMEARPAAGTKCPKVSREELKTALLKLRPGKACADDGLVAEMLKTDHEGLLDAISELFTEMLHGLAPVPASWCFSPLTVLFKKGDSKALKNYRPIAIIPVLSKLFSGILLHRVKPLLDSLQEPQQAGFRPDYGCNDVIHFLRMISEKSAEWGQAVWCASLDLEKAFDKVLHSFVFQSLRASGVEPCIVKPLCELYSLQTAQVRMDGDTRSRAFKILRGVRQGDPLSPILFNAVTRDIFSGLKQSWLQRNLGTMVGSSSMLRSTHVMFADDTTLLASS